ncbi:radical SAM protein [Actinomadura sp. 6N118]|uniref:radical SAM protein n=1 Tax=Actinomadura sp. 6N118 TaxID=3375151 RepID=UPI00378EC1CC
MLSDIAGITRVRMLYLQLLYRCNFSCKTCFHGQLLKEPTHYTLQEAQSLLEHFREEYKLDAVTFLGGEPLLYPHIVEICQHAKSLGLETDICTNAHPGFRRTIEELAPALDKMRASLDGLEDTHDHIRQRGSFRGALQMLTVARLNGVNTGATMVVTRRNLHEVVPLARLLEGYGVGELKLHCLRLVGNAIDNPDLAVTDTGAYADLHREIDDADLSIQVLYDSDLSPEPPEASCPNLVSGGWLDRIESDPSGGLTVSCKAVGRDVHAFRWDKAASRIVHEPRDTDEFHLRIPDVVYRTA